MRQHLEETHASSKIDGEPPLVDKLGPSLEDDDMALRMPMIQYPLPRFEYGTLIDADLSY